MPESPAASPPGESPAHTQTAAERTGFGQVVPFHGCQQRRIDILDGHHNVHFTFIKPKGVPAGGGFCRTGGEEHRSHFLRTAAGFPAEILFGKPCRHFHRRQNGQDISGEIGEPGTDQPHHHRTGTADHRQGQFFLIQVLLGQPGDCLSTPCHFIDRVKSQSVQPPDHRGGVGEMMELSIEGRRRQGNGIPEPVGICQMVHHSGFGMMRTGVRCTGRSQCTGSLRICALPVAWTRMAAVGQRLTQLVQPTQSPLSSVAE